MTEGQLSLPGICSCILSVIYNIVRKNQLFLHPVVLKQLSYNFMNYFRNLMLGRRFKMLLTFTCFLLLTSAICIEKDDQHACLNTDLGLYYCCSDYEDINGNCTACAIGFKSRIGQPCMPCPRNLHGHGCSSLCDCSDLHRCDHVRGCVLKEVSTTANSKTEHITSVGIATSRFTTFDKGESSQGIPRNHLLIYSGTLTGIIFLLALSYCLNNVRKRKTKTLLEVSANDNIVHTGNDDNVHGRSENFELNEDVYHTIDESNMETTAVDKCSPYLEVIEGSSSSESVPNSQSDTSSFPKPYSGLKEDESVNQKKTLSLEINKDFHGQHNATNSTDSVEEGCDECVTPNPCLTLAETAINSVRYHNTTQVVIHKEQSSSSDSLEETQDSNNYLNPYVPLKKEKDAYSYDIPFKTTGDNTS